MSDASDIERGGLGGGGGNSGETGAVPKVITALKLVEDYGCSDSESSETDDAPAAAPAAELAPQGDLSEMVLKNNIINACAHGPLAMETEEEVGAAAVEVETDEESQHIIIDSHGGGVIEYSVNDYRERDSDDSVSSDSSSEVNSVKDAEESESAEEDSLEAPVAARAVPRVRGELGLEDLPPIEDLAISVPEHQTRPIGKVNNIIDKLVVVQAFPQTPAVDIESVLFLDRGKRALGKVFDVFGPVTEPYYCVRFNSGEQIKQQGVERGMEVFIAPQTDHTNYVFVSELMKMRGSDASWLHDVEPPPGQVEFSDDEEERRANRAKRERRRGDTQAATQQNNKTAQRDQGNYKPTPTRFEEQMNRRNLQRTAEALGAARYGNPNGHSTNPFGAVRRQPPPPALSQSPPWGGVWPPPEELPTCPPPFMLARPMFNPYGPPPGFGVHSPHAFRIRFNRAAPNGPFERAPRGRGRGFVSPWSTDSPPPPPPNT